MTKVLPSGIYAPLPTFFSGEDELDLESFAAHAKYVAGPGVMPVVSASVGEAVHLDRQERIELIRALRTALNDIGQSHVPIVAGTGAGSTRETIRLSQDAATAGADFALVVLPGYYAGMLKSHPTAIKDFFISVAVASPIPVVIYNFPGVTSGVDLTSEDIADIANASPNVSGVMLSCGSVGKVAKIAALVQNPSFTILAGFIDFLLPSISVGAVGAISPVPNIAPNFTMEFWRQSQSLESLADRQRAKHLQGQASFGEEAIFRTGVPGLKHFLNQKFGYPANPRLPLPAMSNNASSNFSENKYVKEIMASEKALGL
ncbi:hypothetical protein NQ176_g2650 [Zarea fungicola]|uniref:Uncharacterized protein n=1 Tax=Zarea fungicola TaxID=93591 RepID=A0ACC1NM65_9HYPO|nr:hypothetical protein NQ176_g2650 [Lecanicillium fungicola]